MTISQSRYGMNAEVGRNPIEPRKKESSGLGGLAAGGGLVAAGGIGNAARKTYVSRARAGARSAWQAGIEHNKAVANVDAEHQKIADAFRSAGKKAIKPDGSIDRRLKLYRDSRPKIDRLVADANRLQAQAPKIRASKLAANVKAARALKVSRYARPASIAAGAVGAGLAVRSLVRGRGGEPGRYQRPLRSPGGW